MTDYLTVAELIEIHDDLINRYGGAPGLRDLGSLESALFRPQTGYYHDVIAEAAALWESMSQNHAFMDGNKRVAFASVYTFLAINGIIIQASADEIYEFVSCLYESNTFHFEKLDAWLRENTTIESIA